MIPSDDLKEQKRIYTMGGRGMWRIVGYCSEPTVTMQNILSKRREVFGLSGATATRFHPIEGIQVGQGEEPIEISEEPL